MSAPKRKRGRPSLGLGSELRVAMTPEMRAAAMAAAEKAGVSVAEWVRRAVAKATKRMEAGR